MTVPTVTPRAATSTGVVYTVDPAGPYLGTADARGVGDGDGGQRLRVGAVASGVDAGG